MIFMTKKITDKELLKIILDHIETLVGHIHEDKCAVHGCEYIREACAFLRTQGRKI